MMKSAADNVRKILITANLRDSRRSGAIHGATEYNFRRNANGATATEVAADDGSGRVAV